MMPKRRININQAVARKTGSLLLCLLLCSLTTWAQKFNFINYHVEDGLIQSQATSFVQDINNELWIGTYGGVSRFDGTHFTNYNKANGLSHNMVTSLLRDGKGNIWMGTSAGVNKYDGKRISSIRFASGIVPAQVQNLVIDGDNTIWVLMEGLLYRYEPGRFVREPPYQQITAITIDKMGKLWIYVYKQGLFVRNADGWSKEIAAQPAEASVVYQLLFGDYTGTLYCVTDRGIKIAEQGALRTPSWASSLPSRQSAIKLLETSRGNIWLSLTDGGAWHYDRKNWIHYTFNNGMADDLVHNFFEDAENNIWIATNGNGIFRYGGGVFSYFDRSSGLTAPGIMSIVQSSDGTTYFGGNTAGLYQLSKEGRLQKMDMPIGDNKVNALMMDKDDQLWIGTPEQAGLVRYDGKLFHEVKRKPNMHISGITHLLPDSNFIWMAAHSGLYKVLNQEVHRKYVPLEGIYSVCSIGKDSLLLGSIKGAYIFLTNKNELVPLPVVPDATVLSVKSDEQHVYIGTDDRGVVVWNKVTGQRYKISQRNGLSCDYVYSLLLDRDGKLWVGTGCGIDKVSFDKEGMRIRHYGKSDGLLGLETNANASFESRDGKLWFGTSKGLFIYHPNMEQASGSMPKMLLQSVQLFSKDIPANKYAETTLPFSMIPLNPQFPPKQNHFSFTYKGVYLSNPEKIKYRYQLIGADNSFTETDLTTVIYPNLPPGNYVFKVWSSNADGYWEDNAISYPFVINTPYYKTTTFLLSVILLGIGLILGLVYWRNRQKTKRQEWAARLREEEQARVRQKTAEDFHDEIGNKLTRINLLATIAGGKLRPDEAEIKGLLAQIQKNVTSLYHGAKDIIWSLQPESDYLNEILFHIEENARNMLQDLPLQFTFTVEPGLQTRVKLPSDYSRNLIMIFKEAINNILKHADARTLSLSVKGLGKDQIEMSLTDDGKGFLEESIRAGNGLRNMQNRAERIHAKLDMHSTPEQGTTMTLRFRIAER